MKNISTEIFIKYRYFFYGMLFFLVNGSFLTSCAEWQKKTGKAPSSASQPPSFTYFCCFQGETHNFKIFPKTTKLQAPLWMTDYPRVDMEERRVILHWTEVPGARAYRVYRYSDPPRNKNQGIIMLYENQALLAAETKETSYQGLLPPEGHSSLYWITAISCNGRQSAPSALMLVKLQIEGIVEQPCIAKKQSYQIVARLKKRMPYSWRRSS